MGEDVLYRVALVGNPNTGKTSLFNSLTGLKQRVGNYPGVTVDKITGKLLCEGKRIEILDLPGTYSLATSSPDERVVTEVLTGHMEGVEHIDLVVCVLDATNLTRNLFLASQIADLEIPMLIVLNFWDEVMNQGISIDLEQLEHRLGIKVVPTVAKNDQGIDALKQAIVSSLKCSGGMVRYGWPSIVAKAVRLIRSHIEDSVEIGDAELRRFLFDSDSINSPILRRLGWSVEKGRHVLKESRQFLLDEGINPLAAESIMLYRHLGRLLDGIIVKGDVLQVSRSESIDRIMMHRGWGLVIFVSMMYLVFQSVYSWSGPLMDLIETGVSWLQGMISPFLASWPIVQSLVSDGLIAGVGAFLVFLPQILILYFFISLLEDTGYMARAAFLMDKLFNWCGLNGRSFVPMLTSYACAVPGILVARTINDPKARLITMLISPLMSCSARLPVYILFIGAFIQPRYGEFWAGFTLFGMHIFGLLIALPVSFVLSRFVLKTRPQPFIMELPPYRVPRMRDIGIRLYQRGIDFVRTAGTIICAMTVVIWFLSYFPRPEGLVSSVRSEFVDSQSVARSISAEEVECALNDSSKSELQLAYEHELKAAYINQSYIGRIGRFIQPVFAPAGFDWKITVGILASFPAREVIISTLGILYSLGDEVDEHDSNLRKVMNQERWPNSAETDLALKPVYSFPVVMAIMVFFALCMQCGATLAVITRESEIKWGVFVFAYMTILAWLGAIATYQGITWLQAVLF